MTYWLLTTDYLLKSSVCSDRIAVTAMEEDSPASFEIIFFLCDWFRCNSVFFFSQTEFYATYQRSTYQRANAVPSWVLRHSSVFRVCVFESRFQNIFKQANIVPIFKCERLQNVSDFHPISILSECSRVFFVVSLFYPLSLTRSILYSFFYIPQFFNKILHELILSVRANIQFTKFLLNFISSFRSSRTQRAAINDSVSRWCRITHGMPQDSVLGPVLFCLTLDGFSPISSNWMYIKSRYKNCSNIWRLSADWIGSHGQMV